MNKIIYLLLGVMGSSLLATNFNKDDALEYLNSIRVSAGLSLLNQNSILETASQNHVNYLADKGLTGHYEDNNTYPSDFYTGDKPFDRGVYAGYSSSYYLENISAGQEDIITSIDGLMSAIYHRYGFLNNNIDEIGIGVHSSRLFNYNMGNSKLNKLCNADSYEGTKKSYYGVCAEYDFKIEATLYDEVSSSLADSSPNYVIWPPANSLNILPVFFEESPDPLPSYSVSGYPISIEFNSHKYKDNNISIDSFRVYESSGIELTNTLLMDISNDPNEKHDKYQFTLFPLERLNWNQTYLVEVDFNIDDKAYSKSWSFQTQDINIPTYTITDLDETLILKTDTQYALYFPPTSRDDVFNGISYTYNTSEQDVSIYDSNTILVKLNGENESYCNIDIKNNGTITKTIHLKIGSEDNINDKKLEDKIETFSYKIDDTDIFIKLLTQDDTKEITLNVDNEESIFPLFDINSNITIKESVDTVFIEIKTKLTEAITFEGR